MQERMLHHGVLQESTSTSTSRQISRFTSPGHGAPITTAAGQQLWADMYISGSACHAGGLDHLCEECVAGPSVPKVFILPSSIGHQHTVAASRYMFIAASWASSDGPCLSAALEHAAYHASQQLQVGSCHASHVQMLGKDNAARTHLPGLKLLCR